ncbi:SusC/RagA family TonB-linked outer membrane protein [Pseudobacter ginsenosidimutans]|nr:SusC/RagA family TonB-linked outer membrane protein [Pseudobacter ginsenosidimutans]
MKLTMVLLITSILTVHARGFSQQVTFSGKNVELLKVFSAIETQTGFFTVGSLELLKQASPVSLHVKDMPLETLLQLILKDQPIDFKISEKTIFLFRKPGLPDNAVRPSSTAGPTPILVKGVVLGVNDVPLFGASVSVAGTANYEFTDNFGKFEISVEKGQKLKISYVGYQPVEWKATSEKVTIVMKPADNKLEDVEVVINTGYQKFKPNEMVGSVEVFSEKMLQKQVGTNILQRLKGLSAVLQFNNKITTSSASGNPHSTLNMTIRGWSTINGPTDPLIIVDNFPYQGNIDNINPNDVESIVILKDAAAASIWGARAGNGVIVINTKRGKFGAKPSFSINSTINITEKPDLYKLPLMGSAAYIDQELAIANQNGILLYQERYAHTPVVSVLIDRKKGLISAEDSAAKIDYLKSIDSREQWNKYVYRHALTQDYSMNASGGSSNIAWTIRGNYVKTSGSTQNKQERASIGIGNDFRISSKLDLQITADYSHLSSKSGAPEFNAVKARNFMVPQSIPYLQLADENGQPVSLLKKYNSQVLDTLGGGRLLDYSYYPLTDWRHDYSTDKSNTYSLEAILTYKPISDLRLQLSAKTMKANATFRTVRDKESYYTRDVINQFSQIDPVTKVVNRVVPPGDIVSVENTELTNFAIRAQGTYNKQWGAHGINLMGGLDLSDFKREKSGQLMVGYSEDPLLFSLVNMVDRFPVWFEGENTVGNVLQAQSIMGIRTFVERFVSTTASISYNYDGRYVFYSNMRKDGANILGVKTNDRWSPFWSVGGSWIINKEKFFNAAWVNGLTFRTNVGISGNVDVTRSSNPVGNINQGMPNTTVPYPYLIIADPPNPNLRWEKIIQVNWALDFSLLKDRLSGSVEYYIKNGRDLYGSILADYTQSPNINVKANAASMDGRGIDIRLNAKILDGKFGWRSMINFARITNKLKQYHNQVAIAGAFNQTVGSNGNRIHDNMLLFPGQSLFSVTAIRTMGVNSSGQVLYLVNDKPTTNILEVIKDFEQNGDKSSSYVYFGPSDPKFNFNFNNFISWKNWSLAVITQLKFGYYFKKLLIEDGATASNPYYHKDFEQRWKQPGDELHTRIPKSNGGLLNYAYFSSDLVHRADNIRIENIQLSYDFDIKEHQVFRSMQLALNISNVGIVWRANKEGLDPDYDRSGNFTMPNRPIRMWSLKLIAGF